MILSIDKGYNHNVVPYTDETRCKGYFATAIKNIPENTPKMTDLFHYSAITPETSNVKRTNGGWLVGMVLPYTNSQEKNYTKLFGKYILGSHATVDQAFAAIDQHFNKIKEERERNNKWKLMQ